MIGLRFGRLIIIGPAESRASNRALRWTARCDCGRTKEIDGTSMLKGDTRSCGCLRRELARKAHVTHDRRHTPEYASWGSMRTRCLNPTCPQFWRYGGAGITVCERWNDFGNFLADMGERPEGTTLDRYPDMRGNYEPGNCRWATKTEQARNRKSNSRLTCFGETKMAVEWSEDPRCSANCGTLRKRISSGWTHERAITEPVRAHSRKAAT